MFVKWKLETEIVRLYYGKCFLYAWPAIHFWQAVKCNNIVKRCISYMFRLRLFFASFNSLFRKPKPSSLCILLDSTLHTMAKIHELEKTINSSSIWFVQHSTYIQMCITAYISYRSIDWNHVRIRLNWNSIPSILLNGYSTKSCCVCISKIL